MACRFLFFLYAFFTCAQALSPTDVTRIRADFDMRYQMNPHLTCLGYAQILAKEAQDLIEDDSKIYDTSAQQEIKRKLTDAKNIIAGDVWGVSDRPATEDEKDQYFQVIGTVGFFEKVTGEDINTGSSKGAHKTVVLKLLRVLAKADESVLLNQLLSKNESVKFAGIFGEDQDWPDYQEWISNGADQSKVQLDEHKKGLFQGQAAVLRTLIPFKDKCFRKISLPKLRRALIDNHRYPFFVDEYLSDHSFTIGRDPITNVVYVSWRIGERTAEEAPRRLEPTEKYNNAGPNAGDKKFQERLARILGYLERFCRFFGTNVVFSLQNILENDDARFVPPRGFVSRSFNTLSHGVHESFLYDETAFSTEDIDSGSLTGVGNLTSNKLLSAVVLSRKGSPSSPKTALFNVNLNRRLGVNQENYAERFPNYDAKPADFPSVMNSLISLGKSCDSLAIMGCTPNELSAYIPPAAYVVADTAGEIASSLSSYSRGAIVIKKTDFMIIPKAGATA
ncbi:hypothetical protein [Candidatus Finniella inopinata]|uniref:Uncharacterized protein n=1 Tax=Candidatus Finniella inopinata TaxID=1696036 RepID=A0A4Q7DHF5_9PROT|nr:hypothetical protein [Candidatus Finniella inopinata]RZI45708.1 hypothetical protein EQU50_06300 [Candidatus Finniella inopinata]